MIQGNAIAYHLERVIPAKALSTCPETSMFKFRHLFKLRFLLLYIYWEVAGPGFNLSLSLLFYTPSFYTLYLTLAYLTMTGIVSSVMSHADKIPIVGPMASGWLPSTGTNKKAHSFITPYPPPSYYDITGLQTSSKLSQLSDYVWRQGSQLIPDITLSNSSAIDKKQMEQVMALIHIAAEMGQSGNHHMANDLYMMSIDRMLSALPCKSSKFI